MSGPEPARPADDGHCAHIGLRGDDRGDAVVAVRARVRYLSGEAARAVSAAQGRAILGLLGALDCIGGIEVDQDCTAPSKQEAR